MDAGYVTAQKRHVAMGSLCTGVLSLPVSDWACTAQAKEQRR